MDAFFFFWIGFLVPVFLIGLIFKPNGAWMNVLIILGVICGGLCAYYSKRLFKLQLFITTFFMVFATLPSYIDFISNIGAVIIGFAVALIAGILSTKYKYIVTIITTSYSGAFMLFGVFEANAGLGHTAASVLSVITGTIGLGVQCYVEREELKETYERIIKLKKRKEPEKQESVEITKTNDN